MAEPTPFGRLMRTGMTHKNITQRRLGRMLSVDPDGPIFDATTIRMLQHGERRLTPELVATLIDVLELDWAEAWVASGLMPPEVTAEELRKIDPKRRHRGNPGLTVIGMPTAREG